MKAPRYSESRRRRRAQRQVYFHGQLHAQGVAQADAQSSGDASDVGHRLAAGDHILNQCPMRCGLFDYDRIRRKRIVERLAKPARVHWNVGTVVEGVLLHGRHLFVVFLLDLI